MISPSIYHVKFSSLQQGHGEGLAVFKDGTINGGDQGYLYLGHYVKENSTVTAQIKIKRWNSTATSIFGEMQDFDLTLRGEISQDLSEFHVSGFASQAPELKIMIQGRKLANAV